jgi:hypothetical protein
VLPLLTPKDVAETLKVSLNTARKIMKENGGLWIGNQLRWSRGELK